MITPLQVLRAARQNIADHGWVQRRMGGTDGGFCSLGAIDAVVAGTGTDNYEAGVRAGELLTQAIRYQRPPCAGIIQWNDHVAQSKDEVLVMFDQAIGMAETEEAYELLEVTVP